MNISESINVLKLANLELMQALHSGKHNDALRHSVNMNELINALIPVIKAVDDHFTNLDKMRKRQ